MQAVQPAAVSQVQEPTSVIFLGVDGVLLCEENRYLGMLVFKKAQELFQRDGWHGFSALESRIATTHFFDQTAVDNLEGLIKRCTRRVFIVIFSDWKQNIAVKGLRKVFERYSFSNLIIDKTPDSYQNTEAEKVDSWLRENHCRLNIESFVILDKHDSRLSNRFSTIKANGQLSKSDVEKAHQIMSQSSNMERVALSEAKPHHPPQTPIVDDELPKSTVEKADQTTPPSSIIFLDVDRVILADRTEPNLSSAIINKIQELFGNNKRETKFTELEWRIAASHFFSRKAVANLNVLIEKRSKVTRVFIVIISSWRSDGTVEELRERVFDRCPFSKLIIDKTPDEHFTHSSANPDAKAPAVISMEKYKFDLSTRALQVDFWLRDNCGKYNINSFVILDDLDLGFSERFPKNFIQVRFPLSESNVEKADRIMSQPSNILLDVQEPLSEEKPHLPTEIPKADQITPPSSIVFLDIDGVILNEEHPDRARVIAEKAQKLSRKKEWPKLGFTALETKIAASHFFSSTAVANLEDLIERRKKTSSVYIVIISDWRLVFTIEELRKQVFDRCSFSSLIIDKTPDNHFTRSSTNPDEKDPAVTSMEKYKFDLSSRALQVDFWLRENRHKYNIHSFVILDNFDNGFSKRFPRNFINVDFPLSKSDVEKADQIMSKGLVKL